MEKEPNYLAVKEVGNFARIRNGALECSAMNADGTNEEEWGECSHPVPEFLEAVNLHYGTNFQMTDSCFAQ